MKLKYFLHLFCCPLPLIWASCLGNEEQIEYTLSSDAQIFTFTLSHDSIAELASASYAIDQLNGDIFNRDSLLFGLESKIKQYPKAIFTYTTAVSGGGNISFITDGEDVSNPAFVNSGDSIDVLSFMNNRHRYLRVYAMNGATKEYFLNLRVHTIDPDSMIYEKVSDQFSREKAIVWKDTFYIFSGQDNVVNYSDTLYKTSSGDLYYSSDTITWAQVPLVGDVASGKVVVILGDIKPVPGRSNSLHLLSMVVEINGTSFFVKTDLNRVWIKGDEVPANFPLQDFSAVSWRKSDAYTSNLTLVKGNAIWRTQGDAAGWTKISSLQLVQGGAFTIPNFSDVFYYDDKLHLMNGDGYNNKIYTSIDEGRTWLEMPNKYLPPAGYISRKNASVCVKDNYIYIFGGENQGGALSDVWRAKLNKLSFEN
jgi:hypothetical protein